MDMKRRRVDEGSAATVSGDANASGDAAETSAAGGGGGAPMEGRKSAGPESVYAYRDGYRYAVPWWDTWQSFAKGKWIGTRLYDTLLQHLPLEVADVEASFKGGAVLIYPNQKSVEPLVVDASHVLKANERIVYRFHRHEPELFCSKVKLLEVTDDFVIVRKPATVPMHPIGRFKHNTLIEIIAHEHPEFGKLKITHRLDRLVSGLLILARSQKIAAALSVCFTERSVTKTYIARVRGRLSQQKVLVNTPIGITLEDPPTYGTVAEADGGKQSSTSFEHVRMLPDGSSLVWCHPATGRTHQIRVHLQSIGHPILNDPKYNGGIKTDLTPAPSPPPYTLEPECKECQSGGWKPRNPDDPTITSKGIYLHAVKYVFRSSNPTLLAAVAARGKEDPQVKTNVGDAAAASAADTGLGVKVDDDVVEWEFADGLPPWANDDQNSTTTEPEPAAVAAAAAASE